MRFETNAYGDELWFNKKGQLHNIIDPALLWENGSKFWYRNDSIHRLDGPAEEFMGGEEDWCWLGKYVSKKGHAYLSNQRFFTRRVQI